MERRYVLLTLLFTFVASSCGPGQSADAEGTAKARLEGTSTAEAKTAQAGSATSLAATQVILEAQAEGTATRESIAQALTATAQAFTATAEAAYAQHTEQAQPIHSEVVRLFEQGLISTTEGKFINIADFEQSQAQIDWYFYSPTGYRPSDFVIRSDVEWDLASESANPTSGCGFMFRESGDDSFYVVRLSVDGYAQFWRLLNDRFADLGRAYVGQIGFPSGQAQIMLVVDGFRFTFFVDGKQIRTVGDESLESGELHFTVHSGINTGFGTKCSFSNIELWEID